MAKPVINKAKKVGVTIFLTGLALGALFGLITAGVSSDINGGIVAGIFSCLSCWMSGFISFAL